MKFLVVGAFLAMVFAGTQAGNDLFATLSKGENLAASFINDSIIVNLIEEGESPDVIPEADSDTPPPAGGETGVFDSSNEEGSSGGGDTTNTINEVVVTVSNGASGGEGTGDSGGDEETISAQNLLNTLTGSQAVTSGVGAGANSSGGVSGTSISGSKTREALLSRGITNISIPALPKAGTEADTPRLPYSRADLALIVSAEIIKNPDINDVFYTTNTITIEYKARGRLLLALPIPYSTTISLHFDAPTVKERVKIKFPWYKFLMVTGISKNVLRNQMDALITGAPQGEEYDRAAHIFKQVSLHVAGTSGVQTGSVRKVQ